MCVGELEIGQSSSQRDKQTSGSKGTVCSIEIQAIIHLYALCNLCITLGYRDVFNTIYFVLIISYIYICTSRVLYRVMFANNLLLLLKL